jgi:hypothetical protein
MSKQQKYKDTIANKEYNYNKSQKNVETPCEKCYDNETRKVICSEKECPIKCASCTGLHIHILCYKCL